MRLVQIACGCIQTTNELSQEIGTDAASTVSGCEAACKSVSDCEGIVLDGTCSLISSELDPYFTGLYHVCGAKLASGSP